MATTRRKRKPATRRRRRTMKEPGTRLSRRSHTTARARYHRKHPRKKKSLLSEMFTASEAQNTFSGILSGIVGGAIGYFLPKLAGESVGTLGKVLLTAGTSFAIGSLGKMPNVAAGVAAGGTIYILSQPKGSLKEGDGKFLTQGELESLPPVLSESYLNENYLAANGGNSYLAESYLSENPLQYVELDM